MTSSFKEDSKQPPIVIPKRTFDRLLKNSEEKMGAIALYFFYYYTAIRQKTNQPHATISYAAQGLNTSKMIVRRYKKALITLGLVKDITVKKDGKVKKWYIKLNFYEGKKRFSTVTLPNTVDPPTVTLPQRQVECDINSYSILKEIGGSQKPSLLSGEEPPKSFHKQCATQLAITVLQKLKVNHKTSIPAWTKEFEKLERNMEVSKERIQKVLNWFCESLEAKGTPQAFSGNHFRNKFAYIERAMMRHEITTVEISEEASQVVKHLRRIPWPKGSEELPRLVQQSLDNYISYLKRHKRLTKKIKKSKDKSHKPLLQLILRKINTELSNPTNFIRRWWEQVNSQVANWKGWSGNLESFKFSTESKEFDRLGREWAQSYTNDETRWDTYKKELEQL